MLLLGVGDAAERRTEVDPDPFRCWVSGRARRQRGVVERKSSRDEAELAEPVELASVLGRHPGEWVEVVDLRRDLRSEWTRIKAVDPPDRGDAGPQTRPERIETGPDRGDHADPGDPDTPTVAHVGWFVGGRYSDFGASA